MSEKLITLDEWISRNYSQGSRPPLNTVRRWVRESKLKAEKHGRTYYVREGEKYSNNPYARRIEDATEKAQKQRSSA